MGIQITKTNDSRYPVVILDVLEFAVGGGTIVSAELPTALAEVLEGTPVRLEAGLVHVAKTALLQAQAAAAATSVRVTKAHLFKVGDFITNGKVSTEITGINTTQASYDTLTLTATLDSKEPVLVGAVLYQGTSESVAAATPSVAVVEDIVAATLTLSDATGNLNGKTVTINANSGDSLAVTYTPTTGVLLIRLANTTANKNTAALIQAAIRALTVTGTANLTQVTCTAGGTWDAAAVGGVLTIASDYFSGGVPIADLQPKYTVNGVICGNTPTGANTGVSVVVRGTVKETLCPYSFGVIAKQQLAGLIRFV